MDKDKELSKRQNEGEGNRTAAREYNDAQQRFVRSGKVDEKAHEAERDMLDRDIRRELEQGQRRIHRPDVCDLLQLLDRGLHDPGIIRAEIVRPRLRGAVDVLAAVDVPDQRSTCPGQHDVLAWTAAAAAHKQSAMTGLQDRRLKHAVRCHAPPSQLNFKATLEVDRAGRK